MATNPTGKPNAKRPEIDWTRIEVDYRAGVKSLEQIGKEYGVTKGRISQVAKKENWSRDLNKRIQAKADAKLNESAVNRRLNAEKVRLAERDVVEANAEIHYRIRLAHRKDIERARNLTNSLLTELEQQTDPTTLRLLQELGELMRSEDDNGNDRRNDLYQKVISLGERSKTMKTLADSLRIVVDLERQAFGMDKDVEKPQDGLTSLLQTITSGTASTFKPVAHDVAHDEDD